jgi:hypothetical protein
MVGENGETVRSEQLRGGDHGAALVAGLLDFHDAGFGSLR